MINLFIASTITSDSFSFVIPSLEPIKIIGHFILIFIFVDCRVEFMKVLCTWKN